MSAAYDIFADDVDDLAVDAGRVAWPAPSWRGRHLELARDLLGKRTLAPHQIDTLNAYYSPGRVEIVNCTGQKLGKTETLIIICLIDWAIETKLNGFIMGPKIEWIDEGLWPRLVPDALNAFYPCTDCMPAHRAWCALVDVNPFDQTPRPERCDNCSPLIPSELKDHRDPSKGRKSDWIDEKKSIGGLRDVSGGRHLRGYTARKEGGKGGFSGNVRFYLDESSDVSDVDRETVRGNMSGGGKLFAVGNMLYLQGWFYHAFGRNREQYSHVLQMSSRQSPNCRGTIRWSDGEVTANDNACKPIPGMATQSDIEANLRAWKKGGQNYICARIDAKPPAIVEGQLANMDLVAGAEKRWTPSLDGEGVLQFGVDVARMRDKLAIAVRRGNKIVEIFAEALGQDDHVRGVEIVIEYGKKYRRPHERKPRLVYDVTGPEGKSFRRELQAQKADEHFEIHSIEMGDPPRNRQEYDRRRDELAVNFASWLRHGAIPANANLEAQIEATTSNRVEVSYGPSGRKWEVTRVILNEDIRKLLDGDSPDERNACELSIVDVDGSETDTETPAPSEVLAESPREEKPRAKAPANDDFELFTTMNIYERHASATRFRGAW
jgi:hypothetical protein